MRCGSPARSAAPTSAACCARCRRFLREDARTRAELETRQGWTVNAARLAVAAPWVVLAMLSHATPSRCAAYATAAGVAVLAVGAASPLVAYRVMVRIGRLPEEERVLR